MEIHQILVSASAGDAVTNAAFGFQELLRKVGPSGVFARYIDPRLGGRVLPLGVYEACAHPDDLLIYHASIGEPEVADFLLHRRERLVLVYHNITPPRYFADLDPRFARLLEAGKRELEMLRDRVVLPLAVSRYNADELEALGYEHVRVSPLPLDAQRLLHLQPDPATERRLRKVEGPIILFVGQLLPHKRPDLLTEAFHALTALVPDANLFLVGRGTLDVFRRALEAFAAELQLSVHMPGWVSDPELAAYYRAASCFVSLSEHEGVCVPLIEAMAFDLPVLARSFAAIPETVADAALLLPPEDEPLLVAEALHMLLTDQNLRRTLVRRGRERLGVFDATIAQATFLSHLMTLV